MRDDAILLACRARRTAEHEVDPKGCVIVLQPRFSWKPLQRLMVRWKRPYLRVKLDELGSFVWLRCEGVATVSEIVVCIEEAFGDKVPNVRDRTLRFVRMLARSQLVMLERPCQDP
jgi:hypothetical protein